MKTIRQIMQGKGRIAGYVSRQKKSVGRRSYPIFYYYVAGDSKDPIPPSIFLYAALEEMKVFRGGSFLVNYQRTDWLIKNQQYEISYQYASGVDNNYYVIEVDPPRMSAWKKFSLDKLGTPPKVVSIYDDQISRSAMKVRRLYMLATFLLIRKVGYVTSDSRCHNIASMLVSKEGKVLAWGTNTGTFCHAEVNTLISYFLRNPTATSLPSESLIFSTLKPCAMCSSFIKSTWGSGKVKVMYGMHDPGISGNSPLLGNRSTELPGITDAELDVWTLLSPEGTLDDAIKVTGTKRVQINTDSGKLDLTTALNDTLVRRPQRVSAAQWVDSSGEVLQLFDGAHAKFVRKMEKDREEGAMKEALLYLKDWLT